MTKEKDEYTEEEIRENMAERVELANELLQDHPHAVNTWVSDLSMELDADFKSVNPDTDELETLLGLERWSTVLKANDDSELVMGVGWDVTEEYVCLKEDGEEVPFSRWSDDYDWPLAEYERSIEDVLEEAGWDKT